MSQLQKPRGTIFFALTLPPSFAAGGDTDVNSGFDGDGRIVEIRFTTGHAGGSLGVEVQVRFFIFADEDRKELLQTLIEYASIVPPNANEPKVYSFPQGIAVKAKQTFRVRLRNVDATGVGEEFYLTGEVVMEPN